MTAGTADHGKHQAIVLMLPAIFCFTLMDASVKALAPRIGVLPALWARYAGQMALVLILVAPRLARVVRARYPGLQVLRSVLPMGATGFFFLGISRIPITEASALMAVNPVLITLGAALFLGEPLGPRRIGGIAAALAGALIGLVALFGAAGQMALIRAFSQGEAAMPAPYAYAGLIFATLWGVLFFGEWPDRWTIAGALVIVGAGLYVWHRETRRH